MLHTCLPHLSQQFQIMLKRNKGQIMYAKIKQSIIKDIIKNEHLFELSNNNENLDCLREIEAVKKDIEV